MSNIQQYAHETEINRTPLLIIPLNLECSEMYTLALTPANSSPNCVNPYLLKMDNADSLKCLISLKQIKLSNI